MLGWGQPLHAFDAGKIEGGKLITRRARDGEKIVTLDGVERTLDGEMLVIADVERPLVIAGVFGAVDAEVDAQTTDLVLEAANFSGPSILRTELHTGIRSEASNRFEKGLDAALVPGGLAFADAAVRGVVRRRRGAGHGRRRRRAACAAARCATGRRRPTACSATPCRPPSRRHPAPAGVRGRRGPASRPPGRASHGHAAQLPPRPRARGRPHRGGRAHLGLRAGARDAAASPRPPAA